MATAITRKISLAKIFIKSIQLAVNTFLSKSYFTKVPPTPRGNGKRNIYYILIGPLARKYNKSAVLLSSYPTCIHKSVAIFKVLFIHTYSAHEVLSSLVGLFDDKLSEPFSFLQRKIHCIKTLGLLLVAFLITLVRLP